MTSLNARQRGLQPKKMRGITLWMRILWRLTAILMLVVFGLATAAEAVALESAYQECEPARESAADQYLFEAVSDTHSSNEGSPCHDPCHYGSGHFGHCSCLLFENKSFAQAIDLTSAKAMFLRFVIEDPFLEGLKRPPRLA